MFKTTLLSFLISVLLSCSKETSNEKSLNRVITDTIVNVKINSAEKTSSFPIRITKEYEYRISIDKNKSNQIFTIFKRNDGQVGIRKDFEYLNIKKPNFDFNELKLILNKAKNDFKLDSLSFYIYGTLDSSNDIKSLSEISNEYERQNKKKTISTANYSEISNLILDSNFVKDINSSLYPYHKRINKVNIEKAHYKYLKITEQKDSIRIINAFIVMDINGD